MNNLSVSALVALAALLAAAPRAGATDVPPSAATSSSGASDNDLLALRERLVGTVWSLQLKPMFGEPLPEPLSDTVRFTGGQLLSALFGEQGYSAADFSVSIDDGGIQIWEATQLNLESGIVLWKGELEGQTVRGIVSRHPLEGNSQEFVFTGEEVVPEPVAVPVVEVEPQATPEPQPHDAVPGPGPQQDPQPAAEVAPEVERFAPIVIQAIPDEPAATPRPTEPSSAPATEAAPAPTQPTTPDPKPAAPVPNEEFQPFSPPDFD